MKSSVFVDTQYVIALINDGDRHHDKAMQLAARYSDTPLLTTQAVLLEVGNALARHHRVEAISVLDAFQNSPDVEVVELSAGLFSDGVELYRRHTDKSWGLVDCISFVVMRERRLLAALTYDQHFVQAGFRALMRE